MCTLIYKQVAGQLYTNIQANSWTLYTNKKGKQLHSCTLKFLTNNPLFYGPITRFLYCPSSPFSLHWQCPLCSWPLFNLLSISHLILYDFVFSQNWSFGMDNALDVSPRIFINFGPLLMLARWWIPLSNYVQLGHQNLDKFQHHVPHLSMFSNLSWIV